MRGLTPHPCFADSPLRAQDGTAEDLGDVMSINLKDVVVNQPLAFKKHLKVLAHRIKQALVRSCLGLLATTASGSLMHSPTSTLLTVRVHDGRCGNGLCGGIFDN